MQTQQQVSPQVIAEIAKEVVARLRMQMQPAPAAAHARRRSAEPRLPRDGVFATVDEAVNAAYEAQKKVAAMSLEDRKRIVDIIFRICNDRREELGRMELEETKVGRLDHKILKLTNMRFVLGVDAMHTEARSNHTGVVHHRARAVGRDRHDAAGDAFGADHGVERHQYCCRRATPRSSGRIPRAQRWRSTRCNCGIARSSANWASPMC